MDGNPDEPRSAAAVAESTHRGAGLAIVGISMSAWWPAFTLGAWGTLFFDQLLTVWVASTAGLIVVLTQPRAVSHRWARATALLVPSVWLVLAIVGDDSNQSIGGFVAEILGFLVGLLGIPFTLWTLVRVLWPDLFSDFSRRTRFGVAGVVALLTVVSFLLGAHQASFLTCEDFDISGNSRPPGCVPAPVQPTP